jgi:hypothetical protein
VLEQLELSEQTPADVVIAGEIPASSASVSAGLVIAGVVMPRS